MRVAMVCQPRDRLLAPERLSGSVGIVAAELSRALDRGVELTLYVGADAGNVERTRGPGGHRVVLVPFGRKRLEQGRELLSGLLPRLPAYLASPLFYRRYFEQVAELIRQQPADVIHLHTSFQHAPMLRTAAPAARLVLHLHDPHPAGLAAEAATSSALEAVDAVVTCSESVGRRMSAAFPAHAGKVAAIGNGVDPAAFAGEPDGDGQPPRLLYVGRVSPEKGVHVLGEAFNRVAAKREEVTLDLVGKPGYLPAAMLRLTGDAALVRSLSEFYGGDVVTSFVRQAMFSQSSYRHAVERRLSPQARRRTRFLGAADHEHMPRTYAQSALVVAPSVWEEPFGLPVVEAMAAARPVVASRVGGIPELVAHEHTGLLVEPGDPGALADALLALLDDPERRRAMGAAGRQRAAERWSWRLTAQRLEEVYAALLGGSTALRPAV